MKVKYVTFFALLLLVVSSAVDKVDSQQPQQRPEQNTPQDGLPPQQQPGEQSQPPNDQQPNDQQPPMGQSTIPRADNLAKTTRSFHAMKRNKPIKEDHAKVKKYHAMASLAGVLPPGAANAFSTPEIETESYFGYPMTLDYVVDVYVENTDGDSEAYSCIADTGSSNLAIALADCTDCGTGSTDLDVDYYDPSMCASVTYGSGSWSGVMTDTTAVSMESTQTEGTSVYFSGITEGASFFTTDGFQGILGMGYSGIAESYYECTPDENLDDISSTPYISSLYDDSVIESNVFTMNFCGDEASIAIGGIDSSQYTGSITYVDVQKTYDEFYGYYLVSIDGVYMDDAEISDGSSMNTIGGTLIDSGTTLLYLPTSVCDTIETEVEEALPSLSSTFFEWGSCISESDLTGLPSLSFSIDGYYLELEAADYMLYYDDCYYWGIASSSIPIIGNVALQGKFVVFDQEDNKLGFADSDCSTTTSSNLSPMQPSKPDDRKDHAPQSSEEDQAPPARSNFDQVREKMPAVLANPIMYTVFGVVLVGAALAAVAYARNGRRFRYEKISQEDADGNDQLWI